jgi:predicted nucleic-acid-binding protein
LTKAIDTCVVARIIAQDDPEQTPLAEQALAEPTMIGLSVILESAWLLTSRFRMARSDVAASLIDLIDLPTVSCEQESLARWAISRFADGADMGDMIHLVSARHTQAFRTFDQSTIQEAGADTPVPIELIA